MPEDHLTALPTELLLVIYSYTLCLDLLALRTLNQRLRLTISEASNDLVYHSLKRSARRLHHLRDPWIGYETAHLIEALRAFTQRFGRHARAGQACADVAKAFARWMGRSGGHCGGYWVCCGSGSGSESIRKQMVGLVKAWLEWDVALNRACEVRGGLRRQAVAKEMKKIDPGAVNALQRALEANRGLFLYAMVGVGWIEVEALPGEVVEDDCTRLCRVSKLVTTMKASSHFLTQLTAGEPRISRKLKLCLRHMAGMPDPGEGFGYYLPTKVDEKLLLWYIQEPTGYVVLAALWEGMMLYPM